MLKFRPIFSPLDYVLDMNKRIKFEELEADRIKMNLKMTANQRSQIIIICDFCHKIDFFDPFYS